MIKHVACLLGMAGMLWHGVAFGQLVETRKSRVGLTTYADDSLYVKVTYGRPFKKGGNVFGYNVPWRKLWRTGDDEATEITFNRSVYVGPHEVPAGTYALFTIPDTAQWTLILNTVPGQIGIFRHNPKKDLFRLPLPMYKSPKVFEEMTMYIEKAPGGADVVLIWDRATLRIPVRLRKPEETTR